MFDFNLMKITAEQIQSGRTLSEAFDVAEERRIYLSEEWIHPFSLPQIVNLRLQSPVFTVFQPIPDRTPNTPLSNFRV